MSAFCVSVSWSQLNSALSQDFLMLDDADIIQLQMAVVLHVFSCIIFHFYCLSRDNIFISNIARDGGGNPTHLQPYKTN